MRFRLTRVELFLLLGILSLATIEIAAPRASGPRAAGETPSWEQQEAAVREKLRHPVELDPQALERKLREDPVLRRRFAAASLAGMFLAAAVLFHLLRLLAKLLLRAPLYHPLGQPAPPGWGGRQILQLVLWVVLFIQVTVFLEGHFIRRLHLPWFDRNVAALANTLLVDGVIVLGALALLGRSRLLLERIVGGGKALRAVGFGLRAYLTALPFLFLLLLGMVQMLEWLGREPSPQAIFMLYMSEERRPVLVWLNLLVVVAGPLAEELFFRGLLYGWMRNRWGVWRGLWVSSFLFACLHTDPVAFVPILGLGMLFGWVYEKTGSLAAPVAVHVCHNAGMLTLAAWVKTLHSLQ